MAVQQCLQQHRAKLRMGFPTPNYNGVKTAPGLIVIVADFRFIRAFPVLNDGSELDRLYRKNAERILLQSVAASTMSAHLAAAALGYAVWWITAIGQEEIQRQVKPFLGVPEALDVIDDEAFLRGVREQGERLVEGLRELPGVLSVRGRGLMVAAEISGGAPDIARRALLEQRLIINATGPTTLRFLPPLIVSAAEIDDALARIRKLLN